MSPMPPTKSHNWWTSKYLKNLPRECTEGTVEHIMSILPTKFLIVIEFFRSVFKQNIIVSYFMGFNLIKLLSIVSTE